MVIITRLLILNREFEGNKKEKYKKVERDHQFIQWLFPNFFQSRFNYSAKALKKIEAEKFRTDKNVSAK